MNSVMSSDHSSKVATKTMSCAPPMMDLTASVTDVKASPMTFVLELVAMAKQG